MKVLEEMLGVSNSHAMKATLGLRNFKMTLPY